MIMMDDHDEAIYRTSSKLELIKVISIVKAISHYIGWLRKEKDPRKYKCYPNTYKISLEETWIAIFVSRPYCVTYSYEINNKQTVKKLYDTVANSNYWSILNDSHMNRCHPNYKTVKKDNQYVTINIKSKQKENNI